MQDADLNHDTSNVELDEFEQLLRRMNLDVKCDSRDALMFRCGQAAATVHNKRASSGRYFVLVAAATTAFLLGGIAGRSSQLLPNMARRSSVSPEIVSPEIVDAIANDDSKSNALDLAMSRDQSLQSFPEDCLFVSMQPSLVERWLESRDPELSLPPPKKNSDNPVEIRAGAVEQVLMSLGI